MGIDILLGKKVFLLNIC